MAADAPPEPDAAQEEAARRNAQASAATGAAPGESTTVILKIRRYNPELDAEPHWERYEVPVEPGDRLLDALHYVKWQMDGSLTFRRSCAHGVCGSDAMRVNGVNRLACKILIKDLGDEVMIEPTKGLPAEKDLLLDMEPFFEAFRAAQPLL